MLAILPPGRGRIERRRTTSTCPLPATDHPASAPRSDRPHRATPRPDMPTYSHRWNWPFMNFVGVTGFPGPGGRERSGFGLVLHRRAWPRRRWKYNALASGTRTVAGSRLIEQLGDLAVGVLRRPRVECPFDRVRGVPGQVRLPHACVEIAVHRAEELADFTVSNPCCAATDLFADSSAMCPSLCSLGGQCRCEFGEARRSASRDQSPSPCSACAITLAVSAGRAVLRHRRGAQVEAERRDRARSAGCRPGRSARRCV